MENNLQSTNSTCEPTYLELLAYLGIARHMGGLKATRELVELCHITAGKAILDVGCGVGRTACRLARQVGCRVTGIDFSPAMVAWAEERARKEKVTGLVTFKTADAQSLPFEDESFDALLVESVMVFVPDRVKAMGEFMRVLKPGGYIGLNESTWLKTPVPQEILQTNQAMFGQITTEDSAAWERLLVEAGLQEITARAYSISLLGDTFDRMRYFGLRGMLENAGNMLRYYRQATPAQREPFNRLRRATRQTPKGYYEYQGYGIYTGKKGTA